MLPTLLCAQKFDNVWVMGYNWDNNLTTAETYRLNFDTFPPRLQIYPGDLAIDYAYAGISDSSGKLLLYTNNCAIADCEGQLISNGDSMTIDWDSTWCQTYGWHPFSMHNLFLPMPDDPQKLYLFSKSTYVSYAPVLEVYQNKLLYSVINKGTECNSAKVLTKNRPVLQGRLGYGQITAVKHGNGRDWWIPVPEEKSNKISLVLISKDTVFLHHTHSVGPMSGDSGSFQAAFSPDGTYYVRYNRFYGVYIYNFDRCDGMLSNLIHFDFNDTTQGIYSGCAISPNGRWLYLSDFDSLYQFDLKASDILASKQLVGIYDGHISTLWTKFGPIFHGPDGRLYIKPPGSTSSMHVINRPNLKGVACDLQQHFMEFPNPYGNPPNHPNFRLGPLDGSPCDTLAIDNHPLADFRPDPTDSNALALRFWDVSSYAPDVWFWDFGDPASGATNISQDTSPVHIFSAPGLYTVCLTVANEYSASSKCKVVEVKTSGVNPISAGKTLRLYPNPSTGIVSIPNLEGAARTIQVFDIAGKLVLERRASSAEVDLGNLANGVFILKVSEDGTGKTGLLKVIIQK